MASSTSPLGVDIEVIKPIDMKIAERFFSRREYQNLIQQHESDQLDYFFKLWSLKESYIKAEGKGLSIPLDTFSFTINKEEIHITIHKEDNNSNYFFKMYDIDPSCKMALCTSELEAIPDEVQIIGLRQLYQEAINLLNK